MSSYGFNIAEAFQKYLKTGEEKHIEHYSSKEIRTAISRLSPYYDHNKQWYRQMERRIVELANTEDLKRERFHVQCAKFLKKMIPAIALGLAFGIVIGLNI